MLGVRHTSVTLVASVEAGGFIQYRRGHIKVTDVEGLQDSSCECYETNKAQGKRLMGYRVQ
jgi:hypothetical protein